MEAFEGEAENIYVVTLSGKLSGSYNSAVLLPQIFIMRSMKTAGRIYMCSIHVRHL